MQKSVIKLDNLPVITAASSVVGKKESEGPLGKYFDYCDLTDRFGMKTWEKSESQMQNIALNFALSKRKIGPNNIDLLLAGDLMNQCTSSAYGLLAFDIPFLGLYGACSTAAEGLILSSLLVNSKSVTRCASVSSSHFCSAERQFRFPLEYGGQRTPTAQWTVTGAAAFIVEETGEGPKIADVMPGRTVDQGINDANNMGAAMAPAAIDTLKRYFQATMTKPSDYDLIVTGDLGYEGHSIVCDIMAKEGYDMGKTYNDCGLIIYDLEKQDVHAGGSGCGCSATVLAAHIIPNIISGYYKNVLFIGTGALMSPGAINQGQSIPGIAHLVHIIK